LKDGAVELDLLTSGPYCNDSLCRVLVRVPGRRGEKWSVKCTPAGAPVSVEAHWGYRRPVESWEHGFPGTYGPHVADGRCEGLSFEVTRTGWQLIAVTMPGGQTQAPVQLRLKRTPVR